jgi:hypothetical protein
MIVIYRYRFDYGRKTAAYKEYDGFAVNAPSEEVAWEIFGGIDGEFKRPATANYACKRLGVAYRFTAENIAVLRKKYGYSENVVPGSREDMRRAWLDAVKLGEVD